MTAFPTAAAFEQMAASMMEQFGYQLVYLTGPGPDGGVDVEAWGAVAQVKAHMKRVGRPDVQRLAGVCAARGVSGLFFSLQGYTDEAIGFANQMDIALFTFANLEGDVRGANAAANTIIQRYNDAQAARAAQPVVQNASPEPAPLPEATANTGSLIRKKAGEWALYIASILVFVLIIGGCGRLLRSIDTAPPAPAPERWRPLNTGDAVDIDVTYCGSDAERFWTSKGTFVNRGDVPVQLRVTVEEYYIPGVDPTSEPYVVPPGTTAEWTVPLGSTLGPYATPNNVCTASVEIFTSS